MRVIDTSTTPPTTKTVYIESSIRDGKESLLGVLDAALIKAFGTVSPEVELVNDELLVRINTEIQFSNYFQNVFSVPQKFENNRPKNRKSLLLNYDDTKVVGSNESVFFVECDEIRQNDHIWGTHHMDRVLATFSTCTVESARQSYEWFGSVDNRRCFLRAGEHLKNITCRLYSSMNTPIPSTFQDIFIVLHFRREGRNG